MTVNEDALKNTPDAPLSNVAANINANTANNVLPSFDRADLMNRLSDDLDLAKTLMEIFLDSFAELYGNMKLDIQNGNATGVRKHAHTIAGSAANISARAMAQISREIESNAKNGVIPEESQINRLSEELERLRETLRQEGLIN